MKKLMFVLTILYLVVVGSVVGKSADIGFSINISGGNTSDQIVLDGAPMFIFPASLGFYVAVGIPYDMFFIDSNYYIYRHSAWYVSANYNGPWTGIHYKRLPWGLRKHDYRRIIRVRDEEYRNYQQNRDHYRGKKYRPAEQKRKQENKEKKPGDGRSRYRR